MNHNKARMFLTALDLLAEANSAMRARVIQEITAKTPEEVSAAEDLHYTDLAVEALDEAMEIALAARNEYYDEAELNQQDLALNGMENDRTRQAREDDAV